MSAKAENGTLSGYFHQIRVQCASPDNRRDGVPQKKTTFLNRN
jgi:hypothetical protein